MHAHTHNRTQSPIVTTVQEVIVFVIGGATYEESREVSLINAERESKTRIFLGGTSVQSSKSFLHDLLAASSRADDYY